MEIAQLNEQAIKVLDLARYMDTVFGQHESHLRIAIMAGIGDSYNLGFHEALRYQRESQHNTAKIMAEKKITWELKERIFALAKLNKLEAIKDLKKETGMMLRDAKEFVDKLMGENENLQS